MAEPINPSALRILSFGAGAIGSYIAGSLALHGSQVVFLETKPVIEELRRRGLRLGIGGQSFSIQQPRLFDSLVNAMQEGPFDFVLFALKSFDTRSAIEGILASQADLPPILCLQNGVDNEPTLAAAFGMDKVIAGTVTSSIGRRAAGDIVLERLRGVGIAGSHPLSERLVTAFNQAGLNARRYENAADMKWSKLLTNLPANATSAILNMSPAQIFNHPGLFRLEIQQLRETLAVMAAQHISLVDLPGTPVRLFGFSIRWLPGFLARQVFRKAIGSGRGGKMPSFHIDLYSGRGKSEVNYLNGAVADYGERLGIKTQANRFLTDTLLALTRNQLPLNTYTNKPEKLLEDFRSV